MKAPFAFVLVVLTLSSAQVVEARPVEVHDQLALQGPSDRKIALTLDACSGKFDDALINFLIQNRIPATIFATKKWLNRNPFGLSVIKAHLDLFDVENHGERHIPAVIGAGRTVYGIPGEPDVVHLRREVLQGALAVRKATGIAPRWYRDATAAYDPEAIKEIDKLGYKIAGFSVNADNGATLKRLTVEKRLLKVKAGDVIIAHMNKPDADSVKGLTVGLAYLQKAGFVFVRLDQVKLKALPATALYDHSRERAQYVSGLASRRITFSALPPALQFELAPRELGATDPVLENNLTFSKRVLDVQNVKFP